MDALRLLANPLERLSTHITICGPYNQRRRFPNVDSKIQKAEISIFKTGCFFDFYQNTVFLEAHSEVLQSVISKPDYPKATPHLTIYDGKSRGLAERLYRVLNQRDVCFRFQASTLKAIMTIRSQHDFDLWTRIDKGLISSRIGMEFDRASVLALSDDERVEKFAKLLDSMIASGEVKGADVERTSLPGILKADFNSM